MHRTDADGAAPGGLFTDGDRGLGVPGTKVDAAWLNASQEELCNLLERLGVTLVKGVNTQLRDVLDTLLPKAVGVISSSGGTVTKAAGSIGLGTPSALGSPQRGVSVPLSASVVADGNYSVQALARFTGTKGGTLRLASPSASGFDLLFVDAAGDPVDVSAEDFEIRVTVYGRRAP